MVPPAEPMKVITDTTFHDLCERSLTSHQRYAREGDKNSLTDAITLAQKALQIAGLHDPARLLSNLGFWHSQLYDQTQQEKDLQEAVSYCERAFAISSTADENRPIILNSLASRLVQRYDFSHQQEDLERSISLGTEALKHADQHPHRPIFLNGLSSRFKKRFMISLNIDDLGSAIRLGKESVACTDPKSPPNDLASRKTNLGSSLSLMYEHTKKEEYLLEAIAQHRDAVKVTEDMQPMKPARLCNLGNALGKKYQRTYSLEDLQESVLCHQDAVNQIQNSTNQSNRANILNSYSVRLLWRFDRTGDKSDLCNSLTCMRKLVDETQQAHPSWARYANNLCNRLITRYEMDGDAKDIQEAVTLGETILYSRGQAPASRPIDPVGRAHALCTLSHALKSRYRRTSALSDLQQALSYAEQAVDVMPPTHIDRSLVLENISMALYERYNRFKDGSDLDKAIDFGQEAAEKVIEQDRKAISYSNVGILYGDRYKRNHDSKDLEMAISSSEKATNLGVPHFSRLVNLANWLRVFIQDCDKQNHELLNRVVHLTEEALRLTKDMPQCPEKSRIAVNIAEARELRFRSKHGQDHLEDRTRSKAILEEMMNLEASPPADRIDCALFLADIASSESDWTMTHMTTEAAVKLFPFVSPRCVQQQDQQYTLSQFGGLACKAASAALLANKPAAEALQLLERGRCVISNHRFERRVDVSILRSVRPDLAERFEFLCTFLDSGDQKEDSISPGVNGPGSRRYGAEADLLNLIGEIRRENGFETFLKPRDPTELLQRRSFDFIVVINVSFRSDAFLVSQSVVQVLHLDNNIKAEAVKYAEKLRSKTLTAQDIHYVLQWLWDMIAGPILDALGLTASGAGQDLPHICWIPTGPVSSLPLHAAGYHLDQSQRTVMDRAISSYSPSVKFLEYSFQNSQRRPEQRRHRQNRALIAAMPSTKGMSPLPNAHREAKTVGKLLQRKICINEIETPSKSYLRGELHHCSIFHFAGHAKADRVDPLQSCLAVGDGVVTVEDLVDEKLYLDPPLLAYLSACSTGSIQVDSLVEESIHLAGTFLAAGFQNVIASLWKVSDSCSAEVAELVYTNIVNGGIGSGSIARGLHFALKSLRDRDVATSVVDVEYGKIKARQFGPDISGLGSGTPRVGLHSIYSWASYIHMGC